MDSVVFTTLLEGVGSVQEAVFNDARQRLALITTDGTVSVWQRESRREDWHPLTSFTPHQRPTKLAWAPVELGQPLAVASSSGDVSVWQETRQQEGAEQRQAAMTKLASFTHNALVTALGFAPGEYGLQLTVASPNRISIYAPSPQARHIWSLEGRMEMDPSASCTCFAWKPHSEGLPQLLAVGATTGVVIWRYSPEAMQWRLAAESATGGSVTAVAWAPPLARPAELIAAACGNAVAILSCKGSADAIQVSRDAALQQTASVEGLRWNSLGTSLAVATSDPAVTVWRQDLVGSWQAVDRIAGTEAAMSLD